MSTTMQAAVIDAYRQPFPTIKQVPRPQVRPHDVLVRIVAASINPIDLKTKDGGLKLLLPYDLPVILGSDFAGTVTAVGSAVTDYAVGDAVFGRVTKDRIGTFAEYIAVDHSAIARMPRNLSFEAAAALPLVGLTSYQALHDIMHLQPGQKVLIQGGSGGIGTIAIQLAKHFGAYVATTTSEDHFDLVQSLGADQSIDYHTTNFADVLADYDAVFDTRGGQTLADAFRIVKPGGQVVSIAGLPNARFGKAYGVAWWKRLAFGLATRQLTRLEKQSHATYTFLFMQPNGAQLTQLAQFVEAGIITPVIDRVVPFDQLNQALAYSQAGQAVGKIILKIGQEA